MTLEEILENNKQAYAILNEMPKYKTGVNRNSRAVHLRDGSAGALTCNTFNPLLEAAGVELRLVNSRVQRYADKPWTTWCGDSKARQKERKDALYIVAKKYNLANPFKRTYPRSAAEAVEI